VWDGKTILNTIKGKKTGDREEQRVDNPLMGFHAHIQPGAWAKYISATEALGGSYNRILPVLVKMSKVLPSPEQGEERPIYQYEPGKALKQAYDWARKEKRVMALGAAARRRYDEIRAQFLEETARLPEVLASFIERSAEQVWRVAAVLTAANRKTLIPLDAVEAAYAFVQYSVHSVTQLFNESVSSMTRTATSLDELIRRALTRLNGQGTRSHLYRALGSGRFTAEQIEAEAEAMPDVEVYEPPRQPGKPGARPKVFRLIPPDDKSVSPIIPAQTREPDSVKAQAADAEALLSAYAEWAGKPGNAGKSVSDFLAAAQAPAKPPARKAPAKRSAAPRKAAAATSSTTTRSTTTTRGTVAKAASKTAKATAKVPAKTPAQRTVSARAAKKTAAETPAAGN
jgi:hypothetical protein